MTLLSKSQYVGIFVLILNDASVFKSSTVVMDNKTTQPNILDCFD